jgi:hypothetical protein
MRRLHGPAVAGGVALLVLAAGSPAAASAARGNHPPSAPTHLTVNDSTDPLAVDGTPLFGWLPADRDGNEAQSGYEILVRRGSDGAGVWDSGRVRTSRQSWVPYAGPSLAAGTSYRWTVRTWDAHGVVSPYAASGSFDTGLADGDWSGAAWIRRPATGNDAADEWTLARRVLAVGASPVVRARAYVAAIGDWELHVNGQVADRSSSYGYPGEGYYDVTALAGVRPDRPLAVGVRYHYWTCRCQGRGNGPRPPEGPSGLLVKVVVEHADGSRDTAVSDGSWQVTRDTARDVSTLTFRNSDAGDRVERYNATGEIDGWDTAGFTDSAAGSPWSAAAVIGAHPRPNPASCAGFDGSSAPCAFTHVTALQAHLQRWVVHPVSVRRLPDGTVFADMGKVIAAVPSVRFRAGTAGHGVTMITSYRQNNTTLAAAVAPGAAAVTLLQTSNVHVGDRITIDAPADGYGPGAPEDRTVVSVGPAEVGVDTPLSGAHASGAWVENSRAGTSALDTQGSNMRYFYTQKTGPQTAQPFTYWGWRYLEISDPGETLSADQITAVAQSTELNGAEAATFSSDNPTLDAVFRLMQYSARLSAQNVFLDTPTREKGQFLGDTIDQSFATVQALGERSLTRQAIADFVDSQARYWPNGGLNAVYPNGDGKRDIPDYTEMFPEWVMRYYQLTGDTSTVALALPTMKRVADYLSASIDATGLVHQLPGGSGPYEHGIIDWPPPMRYDTVVDDNGSRTVVNALAVGAMRAVAGAAAVTGDTAAAGDYGHRAVALTTAMNTALRDPASGRYSDGIALSSGRPIANYSQHAQTFAVAYGVADPASYPALGAYIGGLGMRQGPMTLRQLLAALGATGNTDAIVRLLTDPAGDGPAQTLAEGGTFMWEQWNPGCAVAGCTGTEVSQNSSESFSHGWGSAGTSGILESLLGIDVTGPGAGTIRIAPPATGLRHARGTEWTERGPVGVDWDRTRHGFTLTVTVPVNVTATVVLPGRARAWGDGAPQRLDDHGGRTVFTVGSGQTRFRSGAGG